MNASQPLIYAQLAVSRERLRQAVRTAQQAPNAAHIGHGEADSAATGIAHLLKAVLQAPNDEDLRSLVRTWWSQHPLRAVAGLAMGLAKNRLAPIAHRNPIALVCGAACIGAVVVLAKPWRWATLLPMALGFLTPLAARTPAAAVSPRVTALLALLLGTKA